MRTRGKAEEEDRLVKAVGLNLFWEVRVATLRESERVATVES